MNWLELEDKVVVISGASGGIGKALLQGFAAAGARVAAVDYQLDAAEETIAELDPSGERTMAISGDVSNQDSVLRASRLVAKKWGGADILINNAGILRPGPLENLPLADWSEMLEVNLNGCFLMAQTFGAQMIEKGHGALVHVASISASQPQPFSGAYSPGKAAVAMMSRQLAYEWGPKGIRSNVVSPGMVITPLSETFYADNSVHKAREEFVPNRRIGTAKDMANAAVYLASSRADYINGQEIVVDGGLSQTIMGNVPRPGYG